LLPDQATAEELQQSTQATEEKINLSAWKEEMPATAMDEIENLFRSEEEVVQKEAIFNKMNKEYLVQQERKESERLSAAAASKDQEKDDAAQAEGHARYTIKTGRGRKRRRDSVEGESEEQTTEEALYAAVSSRKISRKINYDAMSAIFDEDGAFSTDNLDDGEDPLKDGSEIEEMDPVLAMV
jgi:transcription factor IIIB subunit 2